VKRVTAIFAAFALSVPHVARALPIQDYSGYSRDGLEKELAATVLSRRGVMVPMRDGVGLSTDIYTP